MPLRGLVHFDAFGAFCPDALVHFGSGIQYKGGAGSGLSYSGKLSVFLAVGVWEFPTGNLYF